jgi:alpha-L-fucosidase
VEVLGYDGAVNWSVDGSGLKVSAPGVSSDFPVTLRIRVK